MNGSRLIAGCFRFIFGSRYAESTRSKFGVSAYSRINTVTFALVCSCSKGLFTTEKHQWGVVGGRERDYIPYSLAKVWVLKGTKEF